MHSKSTIHFKAPRGTTCATSVPFCGGESGEGEKRVGALVRRCRTGSGPRHTAGSQNKPILVLSLGNHHDMANAPAFVHAWSREGLLGLLLHALRHVAGLKYAGLPADHIMDS